MFKLISMELFLNKDEFIYFIPDLNRRERRGRESLKNSRLTSF